MIGTVVAHHLSDPPDIFERVGVGKYGPDNPAFVEKQKEVLAAARVVMKDVDEFLIGEKALATMAKLALLTDATPGRLAEFSQKGKDEKALIDKLLNDDELVVQ
ncbi:hypothetical protein OAG64_03470, partial [Akkermansiaceae bacterium]|nr:hypothetical protein [Akkermansiaceae bacterium]